MKQETMTDILVDMYKIARHNKIKDFNPIQIFKHFEHQYKLKHGSYKYLDNPEYSTKMTAREECCYEMTHSILENLLYRQNEKLF